jgi:hypothetical protein
LQPARPVTRGTGVSGQAPRGNNSSQGRSDVWRVRSLAIGCVRSLRELTRLQSDAGTVVSGRCLERVQSLLRGCAVLCDRRVWLVEWRVRSIGLTVGAVTIGGSDAVEGVRSVSTGASGHPEKHAVKGYNGSIHLGCLNTCWPALGEVARDF